MASREALEAGRRLYKAKEDMRDVLGNWSACELPVWRRVQSLVRAAIKVGEVRERGRRSKVGRRG